MSPSIVEGFALLLRVRFHQGAAVVQIKLTTGSAGLLRQVLVNTDAAVSDEHASFVHDLTPFGNG